MRLLFIIPPNFYLINENVSPPLQLEPFYNYDEIEFIQLKRGDSFELISEADIYGISSYTEEYFSAEQIAYYLRQRNPTSMIVLGGSHATCKYKDIPDVFNYVVIGHGETFIENIVKNKFPKDRFVFGRQRNIKWPCSSFKHFNKYNPQLHRGAEKSYSLRLSFGCKWNCNFCMKQSKMQFRDLADIETQFQFLIDNKIFNIRFRDPIFTKHPKFTEISRMLKNYNFRWSFQDRIDNLTPQVCEILKNNNCDLAQVGIESFNENIRYEALNKRIPNKILFENLKAAKENDLPINAFIMLGLPFETYDTLKETKDTGLKWLSREHLRPTIFCPLPGSTIGDNPGRFDFKILTDDYRYYAPFMFQNIIDILQKILVRY